MKAVAYVRVSTEDQSQYGVSLAAQEEKIVQYSKLYDLQIIEVVQDGGYSAKNLNRPGIQRIITMMERKEVQAVIVAKLDRMTRNIRDLTDLVDLANRKGIALISVNEHIDTGSAAGRMILNMLGVLAQWERETIGERTATALQFKKINGKAYNCNALYGFENRAGSLLPVESEQETITLILHLREQNFSYKAISNRLNELGIKSRSGNHWRSEQIRRIILHSTDRNEIQKSIIPNVPV